MTVTYSLDVSKTRFCGFAKLLVRWKGSIYKIIWKEFMIFCMGYTTVSITYRCFLDSDQRASFEKAVLFVDSLTDMIPLSFVLGFYVSLVIGRWWAQYDAIPWPDRLCLMIASYVHGADERSRMIRRTLARYLILLQALTYQAVSTSVKRRFPTTHHLVAAGIMTKEEQTVYDQISFVYGKWWVPCQWFSSLLMRAKKEGRIKDSILLDALFRELLTYRTACGTMMSYDWISVPLVYTQVVTLATYMYATALIFGRQYLDTTKGYAKHQVDLYIPFFTIMQFFFYVGWLKVAEQLVNPYGEDDDDFELNWCLDRTVHVVYLIVDHLQTKHPKIRKDYFWDEMEPKLPQTKHSAKGIENPQLGSAFNLEVGEAEYLEMDTFLEEDKEENMYNSDSLRHRSMAGFRSSFIMRMLNPGLGQSFSKKSVQTDGAVTKSPFQQLRGGCSNPAFDKSGLSTPAVSRKSSFRSFIKKVSPSHSRASSISNRPGSVSLRRYTFQDPDKSAAANLPEQDNSSIPHQQDNGVVGGQASIRLQQQPLSSFLTVEDRTSGSEDKCHDIAEVETGGGPRMEILMPPIPEEPSSRVSSFVSVDCEGTVDDKGAAATTVVVLPSQHPSTATETDKHAAAVLPQTDADEVQNLVKEANEVLRELNRTISYQGHRQDCELKGYESCCSFSSDASSDDSADSGDLNQKSYKSNELKDMIHHDNISNKV